MSFSNAWRTQQQIVLAVGYKPGRSQLADLGLVEGWLEEEIKLLQGFDERKARQASFHGHVSFGAGAHLAFQKLPRTYLTPFFTLPFV